MSAEHRFITFSGELTEAQKQDFDDLVDFIERAKEITKRPIQGVKNNVLAVGSNILELD